MRYLFLEVIGYDLFERLTPQNYHKTHCMLVEANLETEKEFLVKINQSLKLIGIVRSINFNKPYKPRGIYVVDLTSAGIFPLNAELVDYIGIADLVEECLEIPSRRTYWRFKKIL